MSAKITGVLAIVAVIAVIGLAVGLLVFLRDVEGMVRAEVEAQVAGLAIPPGPPVLQVEELIVRSPDGGSWMRLAAGDGKNALIEWHISTVPGGPVAYVFGAGARGLALWQYNFDGTWTEICILEGEIGLCPPVSIRRTP